MPQRIPRSPADIATISDLTSRSGLDFIRAIESGEIAGGAIAGALNFWIDHAEAGAVTFRGVPDLQAMNPMGGVHGGWYGTLLDSAMGCAAMTVLPQGKLYTTLEYKVNLVRGLKMGTEVICTGRVQHAGRSTIVADGAIRGAEDGKLYATGSTTCLVMDAAGS